MSVRRKTDRRLLLMRQCGTCGKMFVTTAEQPWIRQVERDGKRQATTYYCCRSCFADSYKHLGFYDPEPAAQRRAEREKNRDRREYNRRYYAEHADEIKAKKREYYATHPGICAANSRYQKAKRKALQASEGVN